MRYRGEAEEGSEEEESVVSVLPKGEGMVGNQVEPSPLAMRQGLDSGSRSSIPLHRGGCTVVALLYEGNHPPARWTSLYGAIAPQRGRRE